MRRSVGRERLLILGFGAQETSCKLKIKIWELLECELSGVLGIEGMIRVCIQIERKGPGPALEGMDRDRENIRRELSKRSPRKCPMDCELTLAKGRKRSHK